MVPNNLVPNASQGRQALGKSVSLKTVLLSGVVPEQYLLTENSHVTTYEY
jgi:hypothetical protein